MTAIAIARVIIRDPPPIREDSLAEHVSAGFSNELQAFYPKTGLRQTCAPLRGFPRELAVFSRRVRAQKSKYRFAPSVYERINFPSCGQQANKTVDTVLGIGLPVQMNSPATKRIGRWVGVI